MKKRKQGSKWFIVIDCEGNSNNAPGLRELGGLICYRTKTNLEIVDSFETEEKYIEEVLERVLKVYEEETGRYIPPRGIDILTYGTNDEKMLMETLKKVGTKPVRRKYKRIFRYTNVQPVVWDYMYKENIRSESLKLEGVAKALGVKIHQPRHRGINDAYTLVNILREVNKKRENEDLLGLK